MTHELMSTEPRHPSELTPEMLKENIIMAFRAAVKDAGKFDKHEYELRYRRAENDLRMYLEDMIIRASKHTL
jgi:hypothetical protein